MKIVFGIFVGLITFAAGSTAAKLQTTSPPSDADWEWLAQSRQRALDSLMPLGPSKVLVGYRSYRELYQGVMERYFTVRYASDELPFDRDQLTATIVVPATKSIQQQLLELHMQDRSVSLDNVLPRVSVRRLEFNAAACPAIRDQMDTLSKLHLTVPERDLLILHPIVHRIVINLPALDMDATVTDETNPLVTWALQTHDALMRCGRMAVFQN